jgi:cell division FtsZ-interacting protein ZapD
LYRCCFDLPARAALLADYWQKTVDRTVEKWRFSEVDLSSAYNVLIDPSVLRAAKALQVE